MMRNRFDGGGFELGKRRGRVSLPSMKLRMLAVCFAVRYPCALDFPVDNGFWAAFMEAVGRP
jgi:hypothetical protein